MISDLIRTAAAAASTIPTTTQKKFKIAKWVMLVM